LRSWRAPLFVAPDAFFRSRSVQLVTFAAHARMPATYADREYVEIGGLLSYGTAIAGNFHQVVANTGRILKDVKAADLPVVQSIKFEFVTSAA
jgi:putative ABC transport system substrate-binding protein